jgi:hypothetical protein
MIHKIDDYGRKIPLFYPKSQWLNHFAGNDSSQSREVSHENLLQINSSIYDGVSSRGEALVAR